MPWLFSQPFKPYYDEEDAISIVATFNPVEADFEPPGGSESSSSSSEVKAVWVAPKVIGYDCTIVNGPTSLTFEALPDAKGLLLKAPNLNGIFNTTLKFQDFDDESHHVVSKFADIPKKGSIGVYAFFPPSKTEHTITVNLTAMLQYGGVLSRDTAPTPFVKSYSINMKYNMEASVAQFQRTLNELQALAKK